MTFRLYIYSVIFVRKITGIGRLLLKLSLVVGWYSIVSRWHTISYNRINWCKKYIWKIPFENGCSWGMDL